jgi:hypothetical protein
MMVGAGEAALPRRLCADQRPVPARKAGAGDRGLFARLVSGAGLALLVGGAVIAMVGSRSALMVGPWSLRVWQMCFLAVGLPGLLLAAWCE